MFLAERGYWRAEGAAESLCIVYFLVNLSELLFALSEAGTSVNTATSERQHHDAPAVVSQGQQLAYR